MDAPGNFAEFWPHYLRAHRHPTARLLHYLGTFAAMLALAIAVVTGYWGWLVAALVLPYGFAWSGHFFIESNTPLAFSRPLWSLRADFRMFFAMLTGRLMGQLRHATEAAS